ncbi:MAG TPA: hypothetical protein VFR18_24900 [Terriglobia bacterium]|nr:hypothetical protein [Terriglobia bacterium]
MDAKKLTRSTAKCVAGGIGLAGAVYAVYAGITWLRYGKTKPATGDDADALLDQFMPICDIRERHRIAVAAPAEVTFSAARDMEFEDNILVRGIFRAREWILRSQPDHTARPSGTSGIVAQTMSLGWGVLAEQPGREIVMGCATKPWQANPVFRALQPDEFAAFKEPGYVKIVWTLRADPVSSHSSVFRTETRAVATDPAARRKFRRYWSLLSPGIILIRSAMLPTVKADAARRWRIQRAADWPERGVGAST